MVDAKEIITYIIIYSLTVVYSVLVLAVTCFRWFMSSLRFWQVKPREHPPSVLTDGSLGEHKYIQLKNIKLHYVERGDHSKPLMLFVHGFPEFWYSWRHQIREFSKDYWTVAIDMRGYGDSQKPAEKSAYVIDNIINDVKELIPALGKKSCILVAHDWGGAICWEIAAKYPELVDKYIPMNIPHPAAFMKTLQQSFKQFRMSWYMMFFQMPHLPELIIRAQDLKLFEAAFYGSGKRDKKYFTDEDIECYKYTFGKPGALTPPINYYRCIPFGTPRPTLPKITKPVCLIWGDNDIALSTDMARYSKDYVNGMKLEMITGASHWVQQVAPDRVNSIMREFLKK